MHGATLPPIYDWLKTLGAEAVLILPPGAEPHEVALTIPMVRSAARCRRIFAVGMGLEPFLDALPRALGRRCPPIERLGERVKPAPTDLHIWFDLNLVRQCFDLLYTRLTQDEPSRRAFYLTHYRAALEQLQALVRRVENLGQRLRGKYYLAEHDAFRPLMTHLGLRSLGSIYPRHEQPPGVPRLMALVRRARQLPMIGVFGTEGSELGRTLARQIRVPYILLDTLERVESKSYFERLEGILRQLERDG